MTEAARPISVLIVDDHPTAREGLMSFLSAFDDFELTGVATTGTEALELCEADCPDVVLVDVQMPHMDGIAATRAIHRRHPSVYIIALANFPDEATVRAMLAAGASTYLSKDISAQQLADAIRAAGLPEEGLS
jgi:NarL family two-component system response regulator LiaR